MTPNDIPSIPDLPDPLRGENGVPIRTPDEWKARRQTLCDQIQEYAYGFLPPAPAEIQVETVSTVSSGPGQPVDVHLVLTTGPGGAIHFPVWLSLPPGGGPFPVIVRGDACWGRLDPVILREALERGYAVADFDRTEIQADQEDPEGGLRGAYPEVQFGALAAWAWASHRVIDALLSRREIDPQRIILTGHSRGGKAALLAGILDERIALCNPNGSGCMGTGATRKVFTGETLERIVRVFPYWFAPKLTEFVTHEDRLPFDQHTLKALIAPRALLDTEALGDLWANPQGAQLTTDAALPVFRLLGVEDKNGLVYRDGDHQHNLQDWQALLDFADWQLLGKPQRRDFNQHPYSVGL